MDNLYRDNIMDHFRHPRNFGNLITADVTFTEANPLCGDKIGIDVKLEARNPKSEIIKDIRFNGIGCAISMASASILTEYVKGKSLDKVKKINKDTVLKLLGVELTPTRLKCALLPLDALTHALASCNKSGK
jgi:nitrogen fixation protein NifU and related proteins